MVDDGTKEEGGDGIANRKNASNERGGEDGFGFGKDPKRQTKPSKGVGEGGDKRVDEEGTENGGIGRSSHRYIS